MVIVVTQITISTVWSGDLFLPIPSVTFKNSSSGKSKNLIRQHSLVLRLIRTFVCHIYTITTLTHECLTITFLIFGQNKICPTSPQSQNISLFSTGRREGVNMLFAHSGDTDNHKHRLVRCFLFLVFVNIFS